MQSSPLSPAHLALFFAISPALVAADPPEPPVVPAEVKEKALEKWKESYQQTQAGAVASAEDARRSLKRGPNPYLAAGLKDTEAVIEAGKKDPLGVKASGMRAIDDSSKKGQFGPLVSTAATVGRRHGPGTVVTVTVAESGFTGRTTKVRHNLILAGPAPKDSAARLSGLYYVADTIVYNKLTVPVIVPITIDSEELGLPADHPFLANSKKAKR